MLKKPKKEDEDLIEKALDEYYRQFSEKAARSKEKGEKNPFNISQIIPVTLFYVAKSQKEASKLAKKLNILTIILIFLTAILILKEIF